MGSSTKGSCKIYERYFNQLQSVQDGFELFWLTLGGSQRHAAELVWHLTLPAALDQLVQLYVHRVVADGHEPVLTARNEACVLWHFKALVVAEKNGVRFVVALVHEDVELRFSWREVAAAGVNSEDGWLAFLPQTREPEPAAGELLQERHVRQL